MIIKQLIDEDFANYKKTSMFIGFPHCSFKCDKEQSMQVCQNGALATAQSFDIDSKKLVDRYIENNISQAIVIGGLEPFDDYAQLYDCIKAFRERTEDPIIIYTGYYRNEIEKLVNNLSIYPNIIIKFGRYISGQNNYFNEIIGVYLASENQYAEKIS